MPQTRKREHDLQSEERRQLRKLHSFLEAQVHSKRVWNAQMAAEDRHRAMLHHVLRQEEPFSAHNSIRAVPSLREQLILEIQERMLRKLQ